MLPMVVELEWELLERDPEREPEGLRGQGRLQEQEQEQG
jgi:hypothetical protein